MPSIDAANITYNALRMTSGGGISVGGILLGAAKAVHVVGPVLDGASSGQHDSGGRGRGGRAAARLKTH